MGQLLIEPPDMAITHGGAGTSGRCSPPLLAGTGCLRARQPLPVPAAMYGCPPSTYG